jgi:hypothetical protein
LVAGYYKASPSTYYYYDASTLSGPTACATTTTSSTTTTTSSTTTTTAAATTTTTAVCYSSTLGLSGVQGSISGACSAAAQFTYYVGGTKLYTDSGCGTFADAGYYGDGGGVYYQVTGAGNLTGPTSCPSITTTTTAAPTTTSTTTSSCISQGINLTGPAGTAGEACALSEIGDISVYASGGFYYTNPSCTTFVATGFYKSGSNYYYADGSGGLTGPTVCGTTTTTTAAATTTTTAAPTTTTTAAGTTTTTTCALGCVNGSRTCDGDAAICNLQQEDCSIITGYIIETCDPGCCAGGFCIC